MQRIIDQIDKIQNISTVTRLFHEHIDGVWTKGIIVLAPKEDIGEYSVLTSLFREIRDLSLFKDLEFKETNEWVSSLGTDLNQFEPLRLVFSQDIGRVEVKKSFFFKSELTMNTGRFNNETEEKRITREIYVFLFPCKDSAQIFLDEGRDLMVDTTRIL